MGDRETLRAIELRLQAAGTLADAEAVASLQDTCRAVAGALRDVAGDRRLWHDLRTRERARFAQDQIAQLGLLDWSRLLGAVGVEEAEDSVAIAELVAALRRPEDEEAEGRAQELLLRLAAVLDGDVAASQAAPPEKRRLWIRRLRDRAAYGVGALRRMRLVRILRDAAGDAAGTAGGTVVAALVSGVALGPGLPIVAGAVAGGLLAATVHELDRCFTEEAKGRLDDRLASLIETAGLGPGVGGVMTQQVELLALIGPHDPGLWDRTRERLLDWAAAVGGTLAAAWPFVAAHLGEPGVTAVRALTDMMLAVRTAIAGLPDALEDLRAAFARLPDGTIALHEALNAAGFG